MKLVVFFVLLFVIVLICSVHRYKRNAVQPCGVEASADLIHHNPWLVYLEYHRRDRLTDIRCAATLISPKHLLTAAHCVNIRYTKLVARFGEYDTSSNYDCSNDVCADPVLQVDVAAVHIHPGYSDRQHDIAVLELAEEVPYTDFIRPVCLPTGKLLPDTVFIAAGWGEKPMTGVYSDVKKIIPLPFWSLEKCQNIYKIILPYHVICAGGMEGQDTCRGDSGGPLMWVRGRIELWGVTSAGNIRCGMVDTPGLYTSVSMHLEWIKKILDT